MFRALIFCVVLALVALFAAVNWPLFNAQTPVSLGFTIVQAPLGLIMLGLVVALSVLFAIWVIVLQANALRDARRQTKALQAQRDLADKAEASRFTALRDELIARIDASDNGTAAQIAQLEDRLERARVLPS